MHNDVNNNFAARTCIVVVVVKHESNMVSYFPEEGNLNASNADMCSDVAGPSCSGSGDLFELSDRSNETIILLFPLLLAPLAAIFLSGRVTSSYLRSNVSQINVVLFEVRSPALFIS